MNIPAEYNDVIYGLLQKSQLKKVIWNTTTDANTFIVFFDKTSLSIKQCGCINGVQEENWIDVDLFNDLGDKIDRFMVEDSDSDWKNVNELYAFARRSALSIDSAIQEIITEIKKDGIIGKKRTDGSSSNNDNFADDIPF